MTSPQRTRVATWLIAAAAVGIAGVGTSVVLLETRDPAPHLAADEPTEPGATATPGASTAASPAPAASPSPTASPQGASPLADLATLVPQRIAGFRQATNRPAAQRLQQPGVTEARRLHYRNGAGTQVTHVVALHRGIGAAGRALRERRGQLLDRRGAQVTDDTGLKDSDGVRRGRLVEVRRRGGDVVVLWRNRNLVAELGPGRAVLLRRLYDAWPY